MIKFELAVDGVDRKDAEDLLRQLDNQDNITLEENLFDQDEDFGDDLGSIKVNKPDFREFGESFRAYYASTQISPQECLIINFWERLPPHLDSTESHNIERMSDKMLGLRILKQEMKSLEDVDVNFTMFTE